MAPELSSNWKKLQAKIKAEPSKPIRDTKRKSIETDDDDLSQAKPKAKQQKTKTQRKHQEQRSKPAVAAQPKSKKAMGATQSQPAAPKSGITPHVGLWTTDDLTSPGAVSEATESIAQAHNIGLLTHLAPLDDTSPPTTPQLSTDIVPGKYISIDCEMVGVGDGGHTSALARVSLVDFHGRQLYDAYVRPTQRVTDWRTHVSGILPKHVLGAGAVDFPTAQATVAGLLKGRVLVGHDVKHDLAALEINHPPSMTRDTARHSGFKAYGHGPKPALRVLAKEVLGLEIQKGVHSSLEDARTAMLLYRKDKGSFDVEHAARYPEVARQVAVRRGGGGGRKQKRR